jgi:hypothetical protein
LVVFLLAVVIFVYTGGFTTKVDTMKNMCDDDHSHADDMSSSFPPSCIAVHRAILSIHIVLTYQHPPRFHTTHLFIGRFNDRSMGYRRRRCRKEKRDLSYQTGTAFFVCPSPTKANTEIILFI